VTPASTTARPSASDSPWPALAMLVPLAYWTARLFANPGRGCFLDLVDLPFHEAGHLVLAPFGSTLHYLGGTLGQIAVPVLLAGYFLFSSAARPLGAAACAWWTGQSLTNVSVYMADARDLSLPLVGGGDHDWNELFYRFGLLGEDSVRLVSGLTRGAGVLIMLGGLLLVGFFSLPAEHRQNLTDALGERAPGLLPFLRGSGAD